MSYNDIENWTRHPYYHRWLSVPTGWRFTGVGAPKIGEWYVEKDGKPTQSKINFIYQKLTMIEMDKKED
jgi:hypothetical protein